jgi:hypothetical protein
MVITERELLGQEAIERDHRVVIDLHRQRRVVTRRVMHPRAAIMWLVEVRRRPEQVAVIGNRRTPRPQRREVEVRGLVLLNEHDHPMTC